MKRDEIFAELATGLSARLLRQGIEVRAGRDLEEYAAIVKKGREGHPVSQAFWPSEAGKDSTLWFAAFGKDGLVHTQACRRLPFIKESLAAFMSENYLRFPPPNFAVDEEASGFRAGPGARTMSGNIVYHGETWLKEGNYRGSGVAGQLARISFLKAAIEFGYDHLFGFMINPVAHKGLSLRLGFPHSDPHALRWVNLDQSRVYDGLMVYMSMGDLEYLAGTELGLQAV